MMKMRNIWQPPDALCENPVWRVIKNDAGTPSEQTETPIISTERTIKKVAGDCPLNEEDNGVASLWYNYCKHCDSKPSELFVCVCLEYEIKKTPFKNIFKTLNMGKETPLTHI